MILLPLQFSKSVGLDGKRILRAEHPLANSDSALVKLLGLLVALLAVVQVRQVVVVGGQVGMLGAERLFPDGDSALVEGASACSYRPWDE